MLSARILIRRMQINNRLFFLFLGIIPLFSACTSGPVKPSFTDTPTSGDITIVCDESYQPLISVESDTFHSIYQYATVHVKYLPEGEAFKQLVTNDSVRMIICSRELNQSEKDYFNGRKIIPRVTKVAIDAVALVVNNENPDTLIRFEQLKNIVNGNFSSWKQMNPKSNLDSIVVVFDKSGSANARYLQQTFQLNKAALPPNWFATNSNADVADYVSKNKNAIGVISVNWISDRDDPMTDQFLGKIRVVELSPPDSSQFSNEFFKPYQAYIALKQYPLIRDVYMISREGRNGLGTGFASFVAGDQGQRIIRLMGMLPATMPVRLIQVN
ncbi:MAG: substrate-binding domain-containing protein [Bacteroidetes bacterium]|nr:substrate-binding domain-containing protein [Bacteroidota bacterium]